MTQLNRTDQARQAAAAWMLDDYPDGVGSGLHGVFTEADMLDAFTAGVRWSDDHQAAAELPNPVAPRPPCIGHTHGPNGCQDCPCPMVPMSALAASVLIEPHTVIVARPADVNGAG